ncbi:hypothetical protein QUB63_07200 [Microcoleus sp. ARI1-B5]
MSGMLEANLADIIGDRYTVTRNYQLNPNFVGKIQVYIASEASINQTDRS